MEASTFQFLDFSTFNRAVICTHVNPDGDAIGSSLALKLYLERMGKQATVVVPNIFPDFLKWLPSADTILIYTKQAELAKKAVEEADLVIVCDLNQPSRMAGLEADIMASSSTTISTPIPTSAKRCIPNRKHVQQPKSSATFSAS